MLEKLAEQYAKLSKTKILDSKIYGNEIVFVLQSGPKLRMTEDQLKSAIGKATPKDEAEPKAKKPAKAEKGE